MKKCVIFDIDGTLADLTHRRHFVAGRNKDWASFSSLMHLDKPVEQTILLNKMMWEELTSEELVILCSGRSEDERGVTEEWLEKNGVLYDVLLMRPSGDYRADHIIKQEMLDKIRQSGFEPWLVFDDRQSVTDMWRKNGIFVFQADPNPGETFHDCYNFADHIDYPLTIMVGPSGAGKSSYIRYRNWEHRTISSDELRYELTGGIEDQTRNEEVFEKMHQIATTRLREGLPVVLDATHLYNKDRIKAALLVPPQIPVQYVVINRTIESKEASGGWRNEVKLKNGPLIRVHDQRFKSNLKEILAGDNLPNVSVLNLIEGK